jgi:hypothetical protein
MRRIEDRAAAASGRQVVQLVGSLLSNRSLEDRPSDARVKEKSERWARREGGVAEWWWAAR